MRIFTVRFACCLLAFLAILIVQVITSPVFRLFRLGGKLLKKNKIAVIARRRWQCTLM